MFRESGTQTKYRENQSQTDPWDPPYKIHNSVKQPEVLDIKKFYFGKGLPAGALEVEYISESKKLKDIKSLSKERDLSLLEKKKMIHDQVKNNWNYRVAVLNQERQNKLALLQTNIIEDLKKFFKKKELLLSHLWENKKEEMSKRNAKLEMKLQKDLKVLEQSFPSHLKHYILQRTPSKSKDRHNLIDGIDYLIKNYYLSDPYYKEKSKPPINTQEEEGYEEYKEEEKALHIPKPEVLLEPIFMEHKKVNLVTVWQQVLRGLACQKQMLNLIQRHQEELNTIFEPNNPGDADS